MPEYDIEKLRPKPKPWYKRWWAVIKSWFYEEYELTVWYVYETSEDPRGMKTVKRKERIYYLRDIVKHKPTHIIGEDMNGKRFEIKTVEPFDYQIRKIA